jgi:hypothetical protein
MNNPNLSEYETLRAQNIVRNNEKLRELGLISAYEEAQSNASAWKLSPPPPINNNNKKNDNNSLSKLALKFQDDEHFHENSNATKKRRIPAAPNSAASTSPMRKSQRLQGKDPDGEERMIHQVVDKQGMTETLDTERANRISECRLARQRAALAFAEQQGANFTNQDNKNKNKNPTATYEHCLMRVRTMTHKALANRVKAIERAAGKHCVIKMAIFKSCLQDEHLWELADVAGEALERLKALLPPPQEEI